MQVLFLNNLILLFLPQIWSIVLKERFLAQKQHSTGLEALSIDIQSSHESFESPARCHRPVEMKKKILSRTTLNAHLSIRKPKSDGKYFVNLTKRQTNLYKYMQLKWHYTCQHSFRTSQSMEYQVHYEHASNVVSIEPGKNCVSVSDQWQQEFNPTGYGGHLYSYKRRDYRSIGRTCEYRFRGLIEGEVYPWALTSDFVQNTGDPRLEPTVTELCYRTGNGEIHPICATEQLCQVHNVEVISLPPPPTAGASSK